MFSFPRAFRFALVCLLAQLATAAAQEASRTAAVAPGSVLLASADGVSVFDREGTMKFGQFTTSLKDGKPGPLGWSDMIYDGCRLPSRNYLCSSHHFVRELSPDGKTLWEFRVQAPVELKTCVPLPNGDVMTVDAAQMELVQLTDHGQRIAKRIPVPTDKKESPHNRYNLLRRTAAGTFLLALRAEKAFVEVDDSGRELWRHPVPDLPVAAERLANGNTMMSWLGPNGNTLIANSDWHYKAAGENRVQVFEVTRDKKVVRKLGTDAFTGKKPGSLEPKTGNVEHRLIGLQWLDATQ
jgi:hypothetical protein